MATLESTFLLDSTDDQLVDPIARHIKSLLASGLHVTVFVEATTNGPRHRSNLEFQRLVQLFLSTNDHGEGKVATRERVAKVTGASVRTLSRWEGGESVNNRGSAAKRFLQLVLNQEAGFTVTDEMRSIVENLSPY